MAPHQPEVVRPAVQVAHELLEAQQAQQLEHGDEIEERAGELAIGSPGLDDAVKGEGGDEIDQEEAAYVMLEHEPLVQNHGIVSDVPGKRDTPYACGEAHSVRDEGDAGAAGYEGCLRGGS